MKKAVLAAMTILACAGLSTAALADTYTATAQGFGGEVSVSLSIEDGMLTDVAIDGPDETPGVGGNAVEQLPGKMLEANSVEVEGVSGASVTSGAILTAAADALAQSGQTLAAVETEAVTEDVPEDTQTDVVVVGGGIAGMTAAIELADNGKNVILLEKTGVLGGAATLSHSAVWAIGSELTPEAVFTADDIYEFFNKQAGPVFSKEVFYALANESYDSLHFLIDNGVPFDDKAECNPQADPRFWYATSKDFGVGMMAALTEAYNTRSIDTRIGTAGVSLVQDENGAVIGVVAEKDGQQYTITADKVILATGGIGQNPEMMAEYEPNYEHIVANLTAAGATGDGQRMGVEAGGYLVGTGSMGAGTSLGEMDPVTFGNGLLVNIEGEKVGPTNEHYTHLYSVVNEQSNGQAYSIFPSDVEKYTKGGTLEVMEKYVASGELFKADTLEELAQMMGIDAETLIKTAEENNEQYKAGESDAFNSPVDQMILIEEAPFYGEVHVSGMIGTITGLVINENMHVLREDGSEIDNLYAIGELTYGDWFNGNYPMSGTGLGGCVSGGRIAAADILGNK